MSHTNTFRTLSLAAVASLALAAPVAHSAGPKHRAHQITYASTQVATGGTSGCDPTTPTRCAGTFQNLITYTGGMSGTSYASGSAALGPDGLYHGTAIEQFSGTIKGCGTGTVIIEQSGTLDPTTGAAVGSWRIVPDTGTGDLAGASGSSLPTQPGKSLRAVIRCR